MCGIAGFCNWPGTREQQQNNLEKMKQRMLHRGPDAGGSYLQKTDRWDWDTGDYPLWIFLQRDCSP